ncbi:MAG: translocation/assembly module TamB domain-containing protein [Flavobacteriales bacterium]
MFVREGTAEAYISHALDTEKENTTPKQSAANRQRLLRRAAKVMLWIILAPFILLLLVAVLIYIPPVQNMLRGKAVAFLEKKIGTPVQLEHLALRFPIGVGLQGVLIHQQNGDTLLYAGSIKTRASLTALLNKRISLGSVNLSDVRANIAQDRDSVFNFDYILTALKGGTSVTKPLTDTTTAGWGFAIGSVALERIRVDLDLKPSRMQLALDLGSLDLSFDDFNASTKTFHLEELALAHTRADLRMASGPPVPDTYPDLKNPFAGLDIRFSKLDLEDVHFTMKDVVKGDSLWLDLPKAQLVADEMDLSKQLLALKKVEMTAPVFGMLGAAAVTVQDTLRADPPWLDQHDGFRYFVRDMRISVEDLSINDGSFGMYRGLIAPPRKLFDPSSLALKGANLRMEGVAIGNDSIGAQVKELAFTTGPGDQQFALRTDLSATPANVQLKDGTLRISENELTFSLLAQPGDLTTAYRTPERIPLRLHAHTDIKPEQLRPLLQQFGLERFMPPAFTEQLDTRIALSGSIAQLDSALLLVYGDQGSTVHLRAHGANIQEWRTADLEADLERFTLGNGLRQVLRSFAAPGTVLPERLAATSHVHLHNGAAQVEMDVNSDVGNVKGTAAASGLAAKIPDNIAADLKVDGLNVHRLTGDTTIGRVSLTLKVKGQALNSSARSGTLELRPTELRYSGQDLSSLRVNGRVQGDSLFVVVGADAEALKLNLNARGKWPEKKDSLAVAFNMDLARVQLAKLGLMPQTLDVAGVWVGRAAFDSTGHGNISLNADGLRLSNERQAFRFERFALNASAGKDSTAIALNSDAVTLQYRTNVPMDSIIPRTEEKLASYFKVDSTFTPTPGKYMDLAITMPKSDWLTGLLVPKLQSITLNSFTGHYDSDADELGLAVDIPELVYDSIQVEKLLLNVSAKGNDLESKLSIAQVTRDSLGIFGLTLTNSAKVGALLSTLRVQNGEFPASYVLSVALKKQAGESTVHIEPDGLVLDSKPWTADKANLLRFSDGGLKAENFDLRSEEQRLQVETVQQATRIKLENFRIGTLLNFVTSQDSTPFASGDLNGSVELPVNGTVGLAADLLVKDLTLVGNALGDLSVKANEKAKSVYDATVQLKSGANSLEGKASLDASGTSAVIHGNADVAFTELGVFRPFTKSFLYELSGGLNGKLRFDQQHGKAALNGDLTFTDTRIGVLATRSLFRLQKERITFDDAGIHLNRFTMKDSLGNAFTLNGDISTANLSDPGLDLTLRTDAFQLVRSVRGDNKLFYGHVLAGLDLTVTGTANLPKLKGDIHVLDGTDLSIVLPGSEVKLVSHEGIVVFTDGDAPPDSTATANDGKMLQDSLKAQLKGYDLDLHLLVDDQAKFSVVLDPTTGDAATFQGTGDLYFTYNAKGDMTLRGPFTVANGGYTLEFYGLVKKRFDLVKGSTVTWSGDPLDAKLDIKAQYLAQTAAYGLVAGSEALSQDQQNRLQERLPFEVVISVDGSINRPEIDFGINLDRQYRNSYPQVASRLDQLSQQGNIDDRNRQVFGLLVTNAFIPDEAAGTAPSSSIVSSAARNSVNGILTDQLNKLTGKFIKGVDVSLGVNTVDQAEGNTTYQRTSVDYKVSKSFFNDRLSFEVGGSVGVDEQNDQVGSISNTRAAQYVVYYDLSKNGPFRLRGFYENAFDLYDGDITDSGVAIQYTKDFEENERARNIAREAELKRRADEAERKRKERDALGVPAPITVPKEQGE